MNKRPEELTNNSAGSTRPAVGVSRPSASTSTRPAPSGSRPSAATSTRPAATKRPSVGLRPSVRQEDVYDLPADNLTDESITSIRGIDAQRQAHLKELGIETVADLLAKACTIAQRKELASKLMSLEMGEIADEAEKARWQYTYERYWSSWVRQADLRRVPGMDADTAYLLVLLGVRHMEDLAKLDVDKVYPMLVSLTLTQPDCALISRDTLASLIQDAKKQSGEYPEYQEKLHKLLLDSLINTASSVPADISDAYVQQLLTELNGRLMDISVKDILGPRNNIECDDPAPTYLFLDEDEIPDILDTITVPTVVNIAKIRSGIEALKEMPKELNPPRFVRGRVYMLKPGQTLPGSEGDRRQYALSDALVELDGTATANTDSIENAEKPSAYTDGDGWFTIELPSGTNLCQKMTVTVSQGSCRQKFPISADTLLDSCPERKIIQDMLRLDKLYDDYLHDDELYQDLKLIQNRISSGEPVSEEDQTFFDTYQSGMEALYAEIQLAEERIRELEDRITASDSTTNDLSRILRNLTEKTDIVADLSDIPFIVNESVFRHQRTDLPKVMPSVKLMEQDNAPVYLPTDTAPAKIYQYSMLQRLVEPEIRKGENEAASRAAIDDALDVAGFRRNLAADHSRLHYMASLGIGYNLNMHQAWVPDGFALGNLLYSLVLAPGEEQRLIVRENRLSYTLVDEASGTDTAVESYQLTQQDSTDAMFRNALEQMMSGDSSYSVSSSGWSIGGSGSYGGIGLSGGYSSSSSKGKAAASQRNSHSEASSAAQTFQHGIKMASEKLSQAKRLSISMATSDHEESVATRIIANHNHSHTMTIQYWEVMRRYRLETCVDSVDLVLFVPVKPVCFAPGKDGSLDQIRGQAARDGFIARYKAIMDNADVLETALPNKYRAGFDVIEKYSTMSGWEPEASARTSNTLTMSFTGSFLMCDHLRATLVLKNGKGSVAGAMRMTKASLASWMTTSNQVYEAIRSVRNGITNSLEPEDTPANNTHSCIFTLPANATMADIGHIRLDYTCEPMYYELRKVLDDKSEDGKSAAKTYDDMIERMWLLAKDNDNSENDRKMIAYMKEILPESWASPNLNISAAKIMSLGDVTIDVTGVTFNDTAIGAALNSAVLGSSNTVSLSLPANILTASDLQKAEQALQHVMNNTMRYSQAIWRSLSQAERAMMLDQYTIHMDWDSITPEDTGEASTDIPLLNCINVHRMLGFYGNCMLFPFTYPEELANRIGRTAAELQDTLYRHHANNFRVPVTTISVPTDGMIGEAVLGATNVSEEIDLTRFWNWQDSPIDTMSLDHNYLSGKDFLSDKNTAALTALNLSGASQPQGATLPDGSSQPDILSALIGKKLPEFDNLTGQQNLKELMTGSTSSADAARTAALSASSEAMKAAMSHAEKMQTAENDMTKAYLSKGLDKDGNPLEKAAGSGGAGGSASGGKGGASGAGGAAGSGSKTAEILINYYNGTGGVTTVQQSGTKAESTAPAGSKPAADNGK